MTFNTATKEEFKIVPISYGTIYRYDENWRVRVVVGRYPCDGEREFFAAIEVLCCRGIAQGDLVWGVAQYDSESARMAGERRLCFFLDVAELPNPNKQIHTPLTMCEDGGGG
ncbi:hypothetical protein LCGC14_0282430 [marine sediment metagenome]|uniref:Uncharacterized protein n=1 Tax=marine sediment metagenome TaxID=412755 RepID=A0A0F9U0I0_9ZZZZ